ncbi:TPA: hypothetical protein DEP21_04135 [Patescibacteria group bacterium]|nr:hypothetical protein [Candidatus Gracilibacteria bacterium]
MVFTSIKNFGSVIIIGNFLNTLFLYTKDIVVNPVFCGIMSICLFLITLNESGNILIIFLSYFSVIVSSKTNMFSEFILGVIIILESVFLSRIPHANHENKRFL